MARRQAHTDHIVTASHVLSTIGWVAIGMGVLFILEASLTTASVVAVPPAIAAGGTPAAKAVAARLQSQTPWRWMIAETPLIAAGIVLLGSGILVLRGKISGRNALVALCDLWLWIMAISLVWWGIISLRALAGPGIDGLPAHSLAQASVLLAPAEKAATIFFTRAYLLSENVAGAFRSASGHGL